MTNAVQCCVVSLRGKNKSSFIFIREFSRDNRTHNVPVRWPDILKSLTKRLAVSAELFCLSVFVVSLELFYKINIVEIAV